MKKGLIGLLSLVLLTAFSGCGGGKTVPADEGNAVAPPSGAESRMDRRDRDDSEESSAEGSATVEAVAEEAPAAAPAEEPMPETAAPAEEAAAAPVVDGLVGTKWTHNGISLEFKEGNKVMLSGGPLATMAPNGHEAEYTLADGALSVNVFDQVYTGTWDGTKLIVDGSEAVAAQ